MKHFYKNMLYVLTDQSECNIKNVIYLQPGADTGFNWGGGSVLGSKAHLQIKEGGPEVKKNQTNYSAPKIPA